MNYYYVYILKCSDDSYYIGVTNNPNRRLAEHMDGKNPESYTFSRRPVEIVYSEYFTDPNEAIVWEKKIKGWSRRKKEALINDDYGSLVEFSKRHKTYQRKIK